MTNQEVFDLSVAGLASQGFNRSMNIHRGCCYRSGEMRCAIGWLVPNDKYTVTMEGSGIDDVICAAGLVCDLAFARRLQQAHDYALTPADMRGVLRNLAERYGLTLPDALKG